MAIFEIEVATLFLYYSIMFKKALYCDMNDKHVFSKDFKPQISNGHLHCASTNLHALVNNNMLTLVKSICLSTYTVLIA